MVKYIVILGCRRRCYIFKTFRVSSTVPAHSVSVFAYFFLLYALWTEMRGPSRPTVHPTPELNESRESFIATFFPLFFKLLLYTSIVPIKREREMHNSIKNGSTTNQSKKVEEGHPTY
eukprot:gene12948-8804_t